MNFYLLSTLFIFRWTYHDLTSKIFRLTSNLIITQSGCVGYRSGKDNISRKIILFEYLDHNLFLFKSLKSVFNYPDDIVVDVADLSVLPHRSFYILQHLDSSQVVHETRHFAIFDAIDTSNSSNSVNVVRGIQWKIIIDNMTHIRSINTPRYQICTRHNIDL